MALVKHHSCDFCGASAPADYNSIYVTFGSGWFRLNVDHWAHGADRDLCSLGCLFGIVTRLAASEGITTVARADVDELERTFAAPAVPEPTITTRARRKPRKAA